MNKNKFEYVFVYGSLKRGFGNHGFLVDQEFIGHAKSASSDFVMVSLGAFPAVCSHENGTRVAGEVYKVDQPTMASLDTLEGNGNLYRRVEREFVVSNGTTVKAWIYLMPIQIARSFFSKNGNRNQRVHQDGDSVVWL